MKRDAILVIVPTRGRADNVARLAGEFTATATGCAHLLLAVDDDDPTNLPVGDLDTVTVTRAPRNGFAPRLNDEARRHAGDWFALASWGDDHVPRTPGWDRRVLDTLHEMGTGWVSGDDLVHGPAIPTAWAQTSDIVEALGWMTPPALAHLYVDNAQRDLAEAVGRFRYLPDVIVEHAHPIVGKAPWDALYDEGNNDTAATADRLAYEAWRADGGLSDAVATLVALIHRGAP